LYRRNRARDPTSAIGEQVVWWHLDDDGGGAQGRYNVIPPIVFGDCHSLLVVHCRRYSEFKPRLEEIYQHVERTCKPITTHVLFITKVWSERAWGEYERVFTTMKAEFRVAMCAIGR